MPIMQIVKLIGLAEFLSKYIYITCRQYFSMKAAPLKFLFLFFCSLIAFTALTQYNWKLTKDKDGIRVYQSEVKGSNYKSIKVECTLEGTFDKLMAILNDVNQHKNWVYNNKASSLLKRISPTEFYYYSETSLPWPMTNRDAVVHLRMTKDSLNRFVKVVATAEPTYMPQKSGKVRVPQSNVQWYVTMPSAKTIHIIYTFEADPGGSVPAWLVNSFADKGPYESFKKLGQLLKT